MVVWTFWPGSLKVGTRWTTSPISSPPKKGESPPARRGDDEEGLDGARKGGFGRRLCRGPSGDTAVLSGTGHGVVSSAAPASNDDG